MFTSKRVAFFKNGVQRNYVLRVKTTLDLTWTDLARKLGISSKTLADWHKEKFQMSHDVAKLMAKVSGISLPNHKIVDLKDHLKSISSSGGKARIKLHGNIFDNENHRKEKWDEWWNAKGKFNKNILRIQRPKEISVPEHSEELAEFVGIMLGDGTVAPYHIAITLNGKTENEYIYFVSDLIDRLFKTKACVYRAKDSNAIDVVVHRKRLVEFCQEIGLVKGNKIVKRAIIPDWIMKNNLFLFACVRGLIDTDGAIFDHSYKSKGKRYSYKKISFSSGSYHLLCSVEKSLKKLGFNVRIAGNRKAVLIENQADVMKYIREISTHNPLRLEQMRRVGRVVEGGTVLRC